MKTTRLLLLIRKVIFQKGCTKELPHLFRLQQIRALCPIGHTNENTMIFQSSKNPNSHQTVKERIKPSLPVKVLLERNLIQGRVLDFGCGLGMDLKHLNKIGFETIGYDPYYQPGYPEGKFDTIICFYVLNVLLPIEQSHVLMAISELLKPGGRAFYAVRRDVRRNGFRYNPKRECNVYQCNVTLNFKSIFRTKYCEMYEYQHFNQIKKIMDVCFAILPQKKNY